MARDPARFVIDQHGLSQMLTAQPMTTAMRQVTEAGRDWAQAQAMEHAYRTGEYAGDFEVQTRTVKINGLNRSCSFLTNTDPLAWAKEWGHGGHHILAMSVDVMKKATKTKARR